MRTDGTVYWFSDKHANDSYTDAESLHRKQYKLPTTSEESAWPGIWFQKMVEADEDMVDLGTEYRIGNTSIHQRYLYEISDNEPNLTAEQELELLIAGDRNAIVLKYANWIASYALSKVRGYSDSELTDLIQECNEAFILEVDKTIKDIQDDRR